MRNQYKSQPAKQIPSYLPGFDQERFKKLIQGCSASEDDRNRKGLMGEVLPLISPFLQSSIKSAVGRYRGARQMLRRNLIEYNDIYSSLVLKLIQHAGNFDIERQPNEYQSYLASMVYTTVAEFVRNSFPIGIRKNTETNLPIKDKYGLPNPSESEFGKTTKSIRREAKHRRLLANKTAYLNRVSWERRAYASRGDSLVLQLHDFLQDSTNIRDEIKGRDSSPQEIASTNEEVATLKKILSEIGEGKHRGLESRDELAARIWYRLNQPNDLYSDGKYRRISPGEIRSLFDKNHDSDKGVTLDEITKALEYTSMSNCYRRIGKVTGKLRGLLTGEYKNRVICHSRFSNPAIKLILSAYYRGGLNTGEISNLFGSDSQTIHKVLKLQPVTPK